MDAEKTEEEKLIDGLKAEHKHIAAWRVDGQLFIVRRCSQSERARLLERLKKGESPAIVHKELALKCVVHPDRATATSILDENSTLYDDFANRAYELGRGGAEELGKV